MSEISEKIRKARRKFCTAVVVAAGSSTRMGTDKLRVLLGGVPVLARTLRALEGCGEIDEIIVVTRAEELENVSGLCREFSISKCTKVVCGGATRAHSALAGASEADKRAKIICIHDAARPFVSAELIAEVIAAAAAHRAAAPAIPVKDTVRIAENNVAVSTPPREKVFAIQTPQAFDADLIKGALTFAVQNSLGCTDDCAAAEALGVKIHLTRGSEENIKLTTPLDLDLAEAIIRRQGQT